MSDDAIIIEYIGGNCPVQSEGTIGGKPFYFRARGQRWSMSIGGEDVVGNPSWHHEELWGGEPFEAGWMPQYIALAKIAGAMKIYAEQNGTETGTVTRTVNPTANSENALDDESEKT